MKCYIALIKDGEGEMSVIVENLSHPVIFLSKDDARRAAVDTYNGKTYGYTLASVIKFHTR